MDDPIRPPPPPQQQQEEDDALLSDEEEEELKEDEQLIANLKRDADEDRFVGEVRGTNVVDHMLPDVNLEEDLKPKKKKKKRTSDWHEEQEKEAAGAPTADNPIAQQMLEARRIKALTRSKIEDDEELLVFKAKQLIEKMNRAADRDLEAVEKSIPAVHKLAVKADVLQQLRLVAVQENFLTEGGCAALEKWIAPYPNGSAQERTMIRELLKAIDQLPIEVGHLKDNGLGRRIKLESKQNDDLEVRKAALKLFNKWSSLIFESNHDYTTLRECDTHYRKFLENKRDADRWMKQERLKQHATPSAEKGAPAKSHRLVPAKANFDYVNRPESRAPVSIDSVEPTSSKGILQSILTKAKRKK